MVYANRKCCELFGYPRSEFLRLSPLELVIEGQRDAVRERMEQRLRGETFTSEYYVHAVRKDGSTIELEVRGTIMDIGGNAALATSFVDVTEIRRAKEEIERHAAVAQHAQRERNIAQRYLDVAGVMLMVFSVDETISLINRMGCSVLGYSGPEDLLGKNWIDVFIPEGRRSEMRAAFHSFLEGTSPSGPNVRVSTSRHNGVVFEYEVIGSLVARGAHRGGFAEATKMRELTPNVGSTARVWRANSSTA
ncbi:MULTISPECIES: PAS domain S-box protein [unclassified Bradyrhizobium]|uniref:PAS domain-containing protein n=1 Tax=unclassified Bradyrhizobium TaxID=2631580 RepID=UPI0033950E5E